MRRRSNTILILICTVLPLFLASCGRQRAQKSDAPPATSRPTPLANKTLAAFQTQLLDIAFRTATAIPTQPHKKDRAKTQEAVVMTCLALDQPQQALEYAETIGDWRRGAAYAALALYCAQHDYKELAVQYADRAEAIAKPEEDWRRDTIRVTIAQTYACLKQDPKAKALEAAFEPSESHIVAGVRAKGADKAAFDEQMKALDACIASKNFDAVRNALGSAVQWFDSFYTDADRRSQVEKTIGAGAQTLPVFIRIDLLLELAHVAVRHGDAPKGLALVNQAQGLFDGATWPLAARLDVSARLARARFHAGDAAKARADIDATLAIFEAEREKIVNVDRVQALLPLAEAYEAIGEAKAAVSVYRLAVENGVVNPNSRPRAEDLSATCRSMAQHAVEPDAALWARIREVHKGLGNPW